MTEPASPASQSTDSTQGSFVPGLTLRSFAAMLLCMFLAGVYTQVSEVILDTGGAPAEQVLPVTGMAIFIPLLMLAGVVYGAFRVRMLTRAEMICVCFSLLLSIPLMTQGMWHRFVGLIAAPPRTASFQYLDAYSDRLWPHGENVMRDGFTRENVRAEGADVSWAEVTIGTGEKQTLPQLTNEKSEDESAITLVVPLHDEERKRLDPSSPHLVTVLARGTDLGPESSVYCRIYADDTDHFVEVFRERKAESKTYIHQQGFMRLGAYGISMPLEADTSLRVEFGLQGRGTVAFSDPKLIDVSALEMMYGGRKMITRSEWDALPEPERDSRLVVRPDSLWSLEGAAFLLAGYIPLHDWVEPAVTWFSLVLLLLTATFAVNVIMRRQWAESERYPFPNTRIPMALIGTEQDKAFSPVWKNQYAWAGFVIAVAWGCLKGWNFYNSSVPNMAIDWPLGPYFTDPGWGGMWNVNFTVSIFVVSIAIFFELNVLLSLVLGYWLYRSLNWVGVWSDMKVNPGYPWRYEQTVGAYLGYALAVLFFTRTYLWGVLRKAFRGETDPAAPVSYRTALAMLAGAFVGAAVWASWVGASMNGILIFFLFLVTIGFVAAKIRAECGIPYGYFTPYNAMVLVAILGGMRAFGPAGMLVALVCSGFATVSVFYFIPGAQMELIQLGAERRIRSRDIPMTVLIGVVGGLIIGGWVFLSNAYALGGDNIRYQWAFNQQWFFNSYKRELATTTAEWMQGGGGTSGMSFETGTVLVTAGLGVVLTMLRQLFSGFWFHPVGLIFSSTYMMDAVWGSILVAWLVRYLVLKFGGAHSVRNRLQPFFVGSFVGALLVIVLFHIIGGYMRSLGMPKIYGAIP